MTKKDSPEVVEAEILESNEIVPSVSFVPAEIEFNHEELMKRIRAEVEIYTGITKDNSEDISTKDLKSFRTWLNKLSAALNNKRKEIKAAYNEPLNNFETQIKEIDAVILEPKNRIDAIIKQREEEAKQLRREHLIDCYADYAPALVEVVPFDKILDPKWLNASFGEVKAENALMDKVENLANDWEQLQSLRETLPFYDEAEKELFRTLSLNDAIAKNHELVEEQKRIDAMKAQVEEVKEYQQQVVVEQPEIVNEPPQYEQVPTDVYEPQAPINMPVNTYVLEVNCTKAQLQDLLNYCRENGIHGSFKGIKAVA